MLHVRNLRKTYGANTIFSDISFVLNDGERVGLIGANGTGKSSCCAAWPASRRPTAAASF